MVCLFEPSRRPRPWTFLEEPEPTRSPSQSDPLGSGSVGSCRPLSRPSSFPWKPCPPLFSVQAWRPVGTGECKTSRHDLGLFSLLHYFLYLMILFLQRFSLHSMNRPASLHSHTQPFIELVNGQVSIHLEQGYQVRIRDQSDRQVSLSELVFRI